MKTALSCVVALVLFAAFQPAPDYNAYYQLGPDSRPLYCQTTLTTGMSM